MFAAMAVLLAAAATVQASPSHLVVVSGIGGEQEYVDRFYEWSVTMVDAARGRVGMPASSVVYLAEKPERDPDRINGKSSKEEIERVLRSLAEEAGPADVVFILLIGHGSERDGEPQLNLPGPDMSASDFAELLNAFDSQRVVVVNTAPASGGFVEVLSGPNRTVVTATKSRFERNDAVFGGFFVAAFAEDVADTDKDGRVSVLEAFDYARLEVAREYEEDGRLLTEHAMLDDNGDGEGSDEPDAKESDGALARRTFLSAAAAVAAVDATDDPVLAALLVDKADIEQRIEALRLQKADLDPDVYDDRLEDLVVELALKSREIREHGGTN